jgi:hypothetical protein
MLSKPWLIANGHIVMHNSCIGYTYRVYQTLFIISNLWFTCVSMRVMLSGWLAAGACSLVAAVVKVRDFSIHTSSIIMFW